MMVVCYWSQSPLFSSESKKQIAIKMKLYFSHSDSPETTSFSLHVNDDTRLTRLRKPLLEWMRKKLDTPFGKNWEHLADHRGWLYSDIRSHLDQCRHNQRSPFLELLEQESFLTYSVRQFLEDMQAIGRKDILLEFDDEMRKVNGLK